MYKPHLRAHARGGFGSSHRRLCYAHEHKRFRVRESSLKLRSTMGGEEMVRDGFSRRGVAYEVLPFGVREYVRGVISLDQIVPAGEYRLGNSEFYVRVDGGDSRLIQIVVAGSTHRTLYARRVKSGFVTFSASLEGDKLVFTKESRPRAEILQI